MPETPEQPAADPGKERRCEVMAFVQQIAEMARPPVRYRLECSMVFFLRCGAAAAILVAASSCGVFSKECALTDGGCDPLIAYLSTQRWPYCFETSNVPYPVYLSGTESVIAGQAATFDNLDGAGTAARFQGPRGLATDCASLFAFDQFNHNVRRIDLATNTAAGFTSPRGGAATGSYIYVADTGNHTIRQIDKENGNTVTLAGAAGSPGFVDGAGSVARFNFPASIAVVGQTLYIADQNNFAVRRLSLKDLTVSTLAGGTQGTTDGVGTSAQLDGIVAGIATDGTNLYLPDATNHIIRRIKIATAQVTTIAGQVGVTGTTDAVGTSALFNSPRGATSDGLTLYVSDRNNASIRTINLTTLAVGTLISGLSDSPEGDPAVTLNRLYYAGFGNATINLVR